MEYKTERITFRVTPSELKVIENKIRNTNIKISELTRSAVLDKEIIIIDGVEELVKELRAIGNNLNQLTTLSHQGKITSPNLNQTENKLDEIWKVLNILLGKIKIQ